MTVTVTKDRVADVLKQVKALTAKEVLVGVPAENAGRDDGHPINNAEIGYVQEFGSPEKNIPARPFLLPGVEKVKANVVERMKAGGVKALSGDAQAASRTLDAVGLIAQNAVRAEINSNIQPALSPRTLEARRARGVTRTNTLIDTGALRNSITYVVRKGR